MSLASSQEQVLALISAGSTITDAAQAAGLHRNTVHNWIATAPAFSQALDGARHSKAIFWREQAEQLAATAVDTIRAIMADPAAPPAVRLKAAQSILSLAIAPPPPPPALSLYDLLSAPVPQPPPPSETVPNSAQSAAPEPPTAIRRDAPKPGRNDACPCGSGKKFKRCCLNQAGLPADPPAAAA